MADCERESKTRKNYWGSTLFNRGMLNNAVNLPCLVEKVNFFFDFCVNKRFPTTPMLDDGTYSLR